jgi:hypothetical protein
MNFQYPIDQNHAHLFGHVRLTIGRQRFEDSGDRFPFPIVIVNVFDIGGDTQGVVLIPRINVISIGVILVLLGAAPAALGSAASAATFLGGNGSLGGQCGIVVAAASSLWFMSAGGIVATAGGGLSGSWCLDWDVSLFPKSIRGRGARGGFALPWVIGGGGDGSRCSSDFGPLSRRVF